MAVYVDDAKNKYRRMLMCHMLADTDEELHRMASLIGVDRKWWQSPVISSGSHYDICLSKRNLAVKHGAIEITAKQAAAMNFRRKVTGVLGSHEDALEWFSNYLRVRKANGQT